MKKFFLIATPILFCLAFVCQLFHAEYNIAIITWNLFLFSGLGYMYSIGTFRYKTLARVFYIAFALLAIGMLFKLQHWPYGSLLILVSLAAIIVLYAIHFIMKRQKKLLDWMKVAAIVIKAIAVMFWMLHWMYRDELQIASTVMLVLLIAVFYIRVARGAEDVKKEDPIADSGNDIFVYKD